MFQFTHPYWLLALVPALGWILWLAWKSDVALSPWRRWTALALRTVILLALILALAGLQRRLPQEGMNAYFLLDRSESIPASQQELARKYINEIAGQKKPTDKAGVIVFGVGAAIEFTPNPAVDLQKFEAVIPTEGTDLASAIRLGTAAFPEQGQKRLVLLSDGNENLGDALSAVMAARSLGVTMDVLPLGATRGNDVAMQKLGVPNQLKKGQTFEVKIFVQSDRATSATLRLFRNEQYLGEQGVELAAGKNLFSFPQTLPDAGFYNFHAQIEAAGDALPQNNSATGFVHVRGDPRVLVISSEPSQETALVQALEQSRLETRLAGRAGFPETLAEMQSYDAIFLCNIAAGELGEVAMKLLESAVRDFGVGLVCLGGDQAFAAGGYRGTPLETILPVDMELDSKKVLPRGALVLVVHATEFPDGNRWAREIALAALDALGPQDEMGIVLWDGHDRWLFELTEVKDKRALGKTISGMTPGDMPSFQNVMNMAHEGLTKSTANLKHMVVFSDGDPAAPSAQSLQAIVNDRITISTVMIGGHVLPDTMLLMADAGRGRFYDVTSPSQLPQIFIKEAAVILKSAIFEGRFQPQLVSATELVRGIAPEEVPPLIGYVATTPKARAELPMMTDKGDPLLAHWQFGLGRAVAFTSDAKAKWARTWLEWEKYRQFWSQTAQWSLRRLENADFTADVSIEKGEGVVTVEALDEEGNYRNFLNLQTVVVTPQGERQTVRLEQTSPGRYEARFPARQTGAYLLNLMDLHEGRPRGSQVLGASLNYSPEFSATGPNWNLLQRLAELGGGKLLNPAEPAQNSFAHGRQKTFQPVDLWEWLLKFAIVLFVVDVAVRRVQIDREEWLRATATLRRWLLFWRPAPRRVETDESLTALLARRDRVRSTQTAVPLFETVAERKAESGATPAFVLPEAGRTVSPAPVAGTETAASPAESAAETSTTSRLLAARKRAQKRSGP